MHTTTGDPFRAQPSSATFAHLQTAMYAIYRELHPPTGVEHCLECHFFNLRQRSLVVAATSFLRVYNLICTPAAKSELNHTPRGDGVRLVQVAEYQLHGNVQSMDKMQLAQSKREALLLSFMDAKLSVLEYDPEINDLKTVSLHHFEDEDIRGGLLHNHHRPVIRVDPEGRCAAMLVYGTHLAVLPFRHNTLLEEHEPTTPFMQCEQHGILPSYTIDLRTLKERVLNVKDFQFLNGYNNPTVFFLYEPTPTWAGRISLRRDTCCIVAISLNTLERGNPVIWHSHNLPFDCCYCVPVPRPIGGMLIVGANCLLYLNQSSPAVGISLNSLSECTTHFPLRTQGSLSLSMDCSHVAFISKEQLVVSLRGGEIFVLNLIPDGMRGIRNILFEKAAAGVLASCICTVGRDYLFLGSRLGNSLLLKCSKKTWDKNEDLVPAAKRRKSEDLLGEDPDELEVYGADTRSGPSLTSYRFEVCDSVLNIGPIANLTLGEPAFLSEEFAEKADPDLELVTCSGHGKNGAICVLQRGVRPQVVTTFELPGCSDMWTVLSNTDDQDGPPADKHAYLVLGRQDSTMVLQTGAELTELDSSGFATQAPTVFAGNLGAGRYIVQVTSTDIRLLKGVQQMCRLPLDMGGGVRSCDLVDPYAVVLLVDGTVVLLELCEGGEGGDGEGEEGEGGAKLQQTWPEIVKGAKVTLISTYTDTSGLFTSEVGAVEGEIPTHSAPPPKVKKEPRSSIDEEEELLYGDITALTAAVKQETEESPPPEKEEEEVLVPTERGRAPTFWCTLYREDGSLEIYQIPKFKLVFSVRNFSSAPKTLMDSGPIPLQSPHPGNPELRSSEQELEEVLLVGMGPLQSHPHLMALIDQELVVYRAFPFQQSQNPGHLQLRFSKVQHKVLLHDRKERKLTKQLSQPEEDEGQDEMENIRFTPRLRVFVDIAGYSGVFVCGSYPHWVFMTHRGVLLLHPMFIDGPVTSFTPFNNVNCPKGFLYFNSEGELRICVLPSHLSYDSPWPVRKVPTRSTPYFIAYHMESKTHALVTSESSPVSEVPQVDDPEQMEAIERDERFVLPAEERFYLQLYSPTSWESVPNTKYSLERYDHVTCMKVMQLRSQETISGRKEFIVVGATSVTGEDAPCKGKILIFDVIEVIPEPGKPLTKHKLKCLYNQEQKGTISTLEAVDGLLLACMGQKIFMWHFKDNKDLVGVAFIDTEVYIHHATAIKNFILIADIAKSIQLLRYQENLKTLSLISKDQFPADIYSCEYIIDGQQLGFLASDSDQNIVLYQYQPELPESNGGMYLTRRGDFNAGAKISTFLRIHCKSSAPLGAPREIKALMAEKRHITFFATLDGGLGYFLPIAEKTYRRLHMLQIKLVQGLPHTAGLNPKAFRLFQTRHQYLYSPQRNILDGELLWRYPQLSSKEKTDFAKQIGTTQAQILEDLKEMDKVSAHF